jgi:plastocyanin
MGLMIKSNRGDDRMKIIMPATLAIVMSVFSFAKAEADTLTFDMLTKLSKVYSIDIAQIAIGYTVTWLPTGKGHNVDMRNGPDGVKLPKKSETSKKFSMMFETPGVYFCWCTPHKDMGMLALVVAGDDLSNL